MDGWMEFQSNPLLVAVIMFNNNDTSRNRRGYTTKDRPPAFNPHYDAGKNRKKSRPPTSRNNPSSLRLQLFLKHQVLPLAILSTILALWFLTPISNFITSLVLLSVPITSDVQLGLESWHAMQQKEPHKYQVTYDRWGVESIGYDIVNSVIFNGPNINRLCDSIARTSLSSSESFTTTSSNGSSHHHGSFFNSAFQVLVNAISGHDAVEQCKQQALQYNWSFQVIQSQNINAFALPGGIIRVTDSLLKTLHLSKGEIAALLGHEMSHVLHRHGQSQLLKKNLLQTILKAVFYDDGDDEEENFGEAVSELMVRSASFLGQMKFSRTNEYQADSGAWDILFHGGVYNPQSVQRLLEKLYSLEGKGKGSLSSSSYMSGWDKTHPGTGDRIEVLKQKWNGLSWKDQRRLQVLLS